MYQIKYNGLTIYNAQLPELKCISADLTLELNNAGELNVILPAQHKYAGRIQRLKHIITVHDDEDVIFRGRVLDYSFDFYNNQKIYCEGELSFLGDSVQDPFEFTGDIPLLLKQFLDAHNAQVDEEHKFKLGTVTVTDPNGVIVRSSKGYLTTRTAIQEKLLEPLGGYLRIRHEEDGNYIDYLSDLTELNNQPIAYGLNLIDVKRDVTGADIATAILPLGAEDEETDKRLTIETVNNGSKYIVDVDATLQYGIIIKTEIWDDVTLPNNLMRKARARLAEWVKLGTALEISAADLAPIDPSVNGFRLGQKVLVKSAAHQIDDAHLISKLTLNLLNPADNTLRIGSAYTTLAEYQIKKIAELGAIRRTADTAMHTAEKAKKETDTIAESYGRQIDQITSSIIELNKAMENPSLSDAQKVELARELKVQRENLIQLMENKDKIVNDYLEGKLTQNYNLVKSEYEHAVSESASEISETLRQNYYTKDEAKSLVASEGITKFTSIDTFELAYNKFIQDIEAVSNGASAEFARIKKYLSFGADGVTIGAAGTGDSSVQLKVDNDRIAFLENGVPIASWEKGTMNVEQLIALTQIKIGYHVVEKYQSEQIGPSTIIRMVV